MRTTLRLLASLLTVSGVACTEDTVEPTPDEVLVAEGRLHFPATRVGEESEAMIQVQNLGRRDQTLRLDIAPPFFANEHAYVPSGATTGVPIRFRPQSAGPHQAMVRISSGRLEWMRELAGEGLGACDAAAPVCHRWAPANESEGGCRLELEPVGSVCSEPCVTGGVCVGGACSGEPVSCDDGDPCTQDACAAGLGCVHTSACEAPDDPCIAASCDPVAGCRLNAVQDGTPCGASVECSTKVCISGACIQRTMPDGADCLAGLCAVAGKCAAGTCAPTEPIGDPPVLTGSALQGHLHSGIFDPHGGLYAEGDTDWGPKTVARLGELPSESWETRGHEPMWNRGLVIAKNWSRKWQPGSVLTAFDARSGAQVWRSVWPDPAWSNGLSGEAAYVGGRAVDAHGRLVLLVSHSTENPTAEVMTWWFVLDASTGQPVTWHPLPEVPDFPSSLFAAGPDSFIAVSRSRDQTTWSFTGLDASGEVSWSIAGSGLATPMAVGPNRFWAMTGDPVASLKVFDAASGVVVRDTQILADWAAGTPTELWVVGHDAEAGQDKWLFRFDHASGQELSRALWPADHFPIDVTADTTLLALKRAHATPHDAPSLLVELDAHGTAVDTCPVAIGPWSKSQTLGDGVLLHEQGGSDGNIRFLQTFALPNTYPSAGWRPRTGDLSGRGRALEAGERTGP